MSIGSSNIRVLVDWIESTVFAGEEIKCNIIFRNIDVDDSTRNASVQSNLNPTDGPEATDIHEKVSASKPYLSSQFPWQASSQRGHCATHSLNFPKNPGTLNCRRQSSHVPNKTSGERGSHKRSVSIISIGVSEKGSEQGNTLSNFIERSRKVQKGHTRSASLQIIPQKQALLNQRQPTQTSLLLSTLYRKTPISHNLSKDLPVQDKLTESSSKICTEASQLSLNESPSPKSLQYKSPTTTVHHSYTRPTEPTFDELSRFHRNSVAVIPELLSPAIMSASPTRLAGISYDSEELYTNSINLLESIPNELNPRLKSRTNLHDEPNVQPTNIPHIKSPKPSEILMMGYAQIHGSFILDSTLVHQAPFEEVKKKGIIGGQGGGLVGIETSKRDSGLLRNFGWANIGAIGDFLGSNELSSIKEYREVMSSQSIPLLATPQSIIFVDLHLNPGESRCYNYLLRLPHGLPPSYRGKAIKIMYKLVIGVQRPGGANEKQVKLIEVPFRVLGSVDRSGKPLAYDLMCPYIILRDEARITSLPRGISTQATLEKTLRSHESKLDSFISYANKLLSLSRNQSSPSLFSLSDSPGSHRSSLVEEPATTKEAIDMAILQSNNATDSRKSPNRFEISRSGRKVAVLMLTRPAYRLGETINLIIDFTDAKIPCYAIHASLESSERVEKSISLRSEASILRFTRKIYVSHSESTLFSSRIIFTPTIPTSATPEFITSGVSLEWRIRVEFVTPTLKNASKIVQVYPDLLQEVSFNDGGIFLEPVETLDCETFQIAVPLRVYGIHSAFEVDVTPENWLTI